MVKFAIRYWGYLLLGLGIVLALDGGLDPASGFVLSVACLSYAAFAAPTWCGATTRKGDGCRNNSTGLLRGCNQYQQHKWQRAKLLARPPLWRKLTRGLWTNGSRHRVSAGIHRVWPIQRHRSHGRIARHALGRC